MRVLIADDSRSYRMILRQILENQGFDVTEVGDGEAALRHLSQETPPELAILDWVMPGMTGPQVCRHVRNRGGEVPYTYLFLLTGRGRIEDLAEGLDSGADDYLSKPFVRQELEARIMVGQRNARLHAALAEARRELWEQSTKDALTGVRNRGGIQEYLESLASPKTDQQKPLSLIMIDIDFFKRVNDDYGHPAGDAVLQIVARRLSGALRESDEVGRFGGEEFLAVLPETDHEQAMAIAERIRRVIAREPVQSGEVLIDVTASLGVATAETVKNVSISKLISAADASLYRAKESGRNRVESAETPAKVRYESAEVLPNVRYFPEVASAR